MALVQNANTIVDLFLPPFVSIPNSLSTVYTTEMNLPTGWDYQYVIMEMSPTSLTASCVSEVRFYQNGNQFFRMSGSDLDTMNQYFKIPASNAYQTYNSTNFLVIPFYRPGLSDGSMFNATNYGIKSGAVSAKDLSTIVSVNTGSPDTSGQSINSFVIQVDWNTTPGSGSLLCNLRAGVYNAFPGGPGMIPFVDKLIFNAVAGTNVGTQQTFVNYGNIQHNWLDWHVSVPASGAGTLATTNAFDWSLNGNRQRYELGDEQSFINALHDLRTPQAGYYVMDCTSAWGDESWYVGPADTSIQCQFNSTVAQSVKVYERCAGFPWTPPAAASSAS